ncbi:MAG TPA: universal stress protein [Anaerolineae bacterium]|nr:universal stress protein [Anaerolineae bacterium]
MSQELPVDNAVQDFHQARRQAAMEELVARFTGKSTKLLSFNEVSQRLKSPDTVEKGVQEIPLEAIVGSSGRYDDFTRSFLPLRKSDQDRWASVQAYVKQKGIGNMPPIAVYQIGEIYFVSDGNHRVSIARRMGLTHIRASVIELQTKVALSPDDRPDDLILKTEYADFLARSNLDESRPEADLRLTVPGKYWILEAQIEAQVFLAGGDSEQPVSFEEAAVLWYDSVYSGVAQLIRDRALLRDFPDRTEADLYVWAFEHRAKLKQVLEWDMGIGTALQDFTAQQKAELKGAAQRIQQLKGRMTPKQLASNPVKTGAWQKEKAIAHDQSRLFYNILVAITGDAAGWQAFDQSVEMAKRERGRLRGLHIVASEAERSSAAVQALKAEFDDRCRAAGINGKLSIEAGQPVEKICERSSLADVVVAPLLNPPGANLASRLSSEFRALVQRSARPVLAVPDQPTGLHRALLAYDGSSKAKEALYVATYLSGRWGMPLVVLTVAEGKFVDRSIENEAKAYLEAHDLQPLFVQKNGSVATAIVETSAEQDIDLIIMGGYSRSPVQGLLLGDSVDELLRRSKQPILICR